MDKARWFVAVLTMVAIPPGVAAWYAIHPFVRFWRRLGTATSFRVIYSVMIAACLLLWEFSPALIGRDMGFRPLLLVLAVPAAAAGLVIASRRRRFLTQRILVGMPEISNSDKGRLLTDGIYGTVRNPRYLESVLLSFVCVAFANYTGTWLLYALMFPALHLVVLLEERELRERFGTEYENYCRRVPRYLPKLGAAARPPRGQSRV